MNENIKLNPDSLWSQADVEAGNRIPATDTDTEIDWGDSPESVLVFESPVAFERIVESPAALV